MAKELGSFDAWVFGTGHELEDELTLEPQPLNELRMDLNNNDVGRQCGKDKTRSCEDNCMDALMFGELTTINPPNKGIGAY